MIGHRLGGVRQEVGMVLGKPASAGFLLPVENASGYRRLSFLLRSMALRLSM